MDHPGVDVDHQFGISHEDKIVIRETKEREVYCIPVLDYDSASSSNSDQDSLTSISLNVILNELEDNQVKGFKAKVSREVLQEWMEKDNANVKSSESDSAPACTTASFSSFIDDVKCSFACVDGYGVTIKDGLADGEAILELWKSVDDPDSADGSGKKKNVYGSCDLKHLDVSVALSSFFRGLHSFRNSVKDSSEANREIQKWKGKYTEAFDTFKQLKIDKNKQIDLLYRSFNEILNNKKAAMNDLKNQIKSSSRKRGVQEQHVHDDEQPSTSSGVKSRRLNKKPRIIDSSDEEEQEPPNLKNDQNTDTDDDITRSPDTLAKEIGNDSEYDQSTDDEDQKKANDSKKEKVKQTKNAKNSTKNKDKDSNDNDMIQIDMDSSSSQSQEIEIDQLSKVRKYKLKSNTSPRKR